jgi:hypothetical protein
MRPKESDDTPQESRQQWTSLDEGKGEIKKQPPHHLHGHPAHALVIALVKATLSPMGGGNITMHQNCLCVVQNPVKTGGSKRKDPDAMEVDTIRTKTMHANHLSDEEWQQLLKEGQCFNCKKLGHMTHTCPDKQRMSRSTNNRQGGQMMTPLHPTQGTLCVCTAVINEDKEDAKEEKGKEKEDVPLAYKPKSLIEHIKQLNATDHEDLLERLALKVDF